MSNIEIPGFPNRICPGCNGGAFRAEPSMMDGKRIGTAYICIHCDMQVDFVPTEEYAEELRKAEEEDEARRREEERLETLGNRIYAVNLFYQGGGYQGYGGFAVKECGMDPDKALEKAVACVEKALMENMDRFMGGTVVQEEYPDGWGRGIEPSSEKVVRRFGVTCECQYIRDGKGFKRVLNWYKDDDLERTEELHRRTFTS